MTLEFDKSKPPKGWSSFPIKPGQKYFSIDGGDNIIVNKGFSQSDQIVIDDFGLAGIIKRLISLYFCNI